MRKTFKIALAGNPNSGKSTIFNNLTGAHQHVGNYPGVTVEKKEGHRTFEGEELFFTDLPGIYSLGARSEEEIITRNFILEEKPDLIINVIDAAHIERNLYLTLQIMELKTPIILALNMVDIAESKGHFIDIPKLSKSLGVPIIKTIGNKKEGIEQLLKTIRECMTGKIQTTGVLLNYGEEIEGEIEKISRVIPEELIPAFGFTKRVIAIKLLENDSEIITKFSKSKGSIKLFDELKRSTAYLEKFYNGSPEIMLVDKRYGFISGAHSEAVKFSAEKKHDYSDSIDIVLTHRLFGIPIFLAIMWIIFSVTFKAGEPFVNGIEFIFGAINSYFYSLIGSDILRSVVCDGVISGVGGVVSFVPNIMLLFMFISILEDSGYMARGAFIMDNMMHKMGLHGKSFIPLLIGFGCSVPAIMATRTLENKKDRIITMLITPLMSCSARLPVYALLISAFFSPKIGGHILFSIYVLGIAIAVIAANVFKKVFFKGEESHLVMELPPYTVPTLIGISTHVWRRAYSYLKKAGTIILSISILMWFLSHFPSNDPNPKTRLENSFTGTIGKTIAPVLAPIGLGDWKVAVSLVSGFAAKEVVVSTLGTLYSLESVDESSSLLRSALTKDPFFSPLRAYAAMIFVLLSCPCLATFAVIRQETRSFRWPLIMILYTTFTAWIVCFFIFQIGSLFGF